MRLTRLLVNKFNLVGGENMIHPDFVSLFERFINNPNAKNLNLTIITNGTMVPPIVLDNAHRFNSVSMLCSIDGVAERGAYVRSGLKWNTFDKNIRIYQNHPHISTSFLVATQMLNIGYLGDIYDYLVYDLGIPYKRINWNNVVTSPAKWRAVNLPDHIKAKYLEKLKKHEISQLNWLPYDRIEQILLSPQGSNDEFLKGIQELKTLDAVRNSYMPSHFPELDEYYQLAPEPKIKLLR
jgi:sulfatase maturation enzyme AslB (radical SAM superfamily)